MNLDFTKESAKLALSSIRERKLRSSLTVLGIVIGIAAVISMIAIGDGTNAYIQEQFEQLGANKIIITPGGTGASSFIGGQELSEKDLEIIEGVRGVEKAIPVFYKSLSIEHKDEIMSTFIIGIGSEDAKDFFEGSQMDIESGRWIRPGDRYVVVIGNMVEDEIFSDDVKVRDKLVIKNKSFEVIGVMKEIGNSQDDSQLYVPIEVLRELTGEEGKISSIFAQAFDANEVEDVADRIQEKLDNKYGEESFTVMSTTTLANQISGITATLSFVLGAIAGIALIVAGIGIANTMYMSILERTKEIGIMKAIGATDGNILQIFLTEAAILGFIGGLLGLLTGEGVTRIISIVLESSGLPLKTDVSANLALSGLIFAMVVGIVSGLFPARTAAKMNPIDALRYE